MLRLCFPAIMWLMFSYQAYAGNTADTNNTENPTTAPVIIQSGGAVDGQFALAVGGQTIAAAFLPQTLGEPRGAIILLHDESAQFDSPLMHQLRQQLTTYGWDTLTVSLNFKQIKIAEKSETADADEQAPVGEATAPASDAPTTETETETATNKPATTESVAENTADLPVTGTSPTNPARMDAAIAWLQAKNPARLIFIGHGAGIQTAVNAISATPQTISALVLLSADAQTTADTIIDANLPVLDIIGSRAADTAKRAALLRGSQLKTDAIQPYSQRQLTGADRNFQGMEKLLGKQIHSWLYSQLMGG